MFGLTKREQRWKAEQQAAELLVGLAQSTVRAAADVRIAEANAELDRLRKENAELRTTPSASAEPSGETMAQREEVCAAWSALPDDLRKDPRLARLYRALGGPRMDDPTEATTSDAGGNDAPR